MEPPKNPVLFVLYAAACTLLAATTVFYVIGCILLHGG